MKNTIRAGTIAAIILVAGVRPGWSCGFVESIPRDLVTLRMDAENCKLLLYGHLENAKAMELGGGTTDLVIANVLKTDPVLGEKKRVVLPRYIPIDDPKNPPRMLVFGDVLKGKPDFYRGIPCGQAAVDYVKGLLTIDGKCRVAVMRYCFNFLDHPEGMIATDAFHEFMKSPDKDIGEAAQKLSPGKLRKWLRDERTPKDRLRLYGFLLANCGNDKDADLLRAVFQRYAAQENSPLLDGILTGYAMLRPREGWDYIGELASKPSTSFWMRFTALRTARFFHNTRPDIIGEKDILDLMNVLLDHADIADMAINDLRLWRCWSLTDRILSLYGRNTYDTPVMRRNIIRYALQCPEPRATRFVEGLRKQDGDLVEEVEEGLKLETQSRSPTR